MKALASTLILFLACSVGFSQSGRRVSDVKATSSPDPVPVTRLISVVRPTNERHLDYRCTRDGHHRVPETEDEIEQVLSSKMVDTRAVFRAKPRPGYTLEAQRNRKQGFVILKVALSAMGTISRVRVLRGLPFGLTESAIKAACKLQFKPAMKDGQSVSQWVTAEYVFRLPDSRLFKQ
ncbi:MAG: energy transducer TonB [Pyrinomonadaceae bacterium]